MLSTGTLSVGQLVQEEGDNKAGGSPSPGVLDLIGDLSLVVVGSYGLTGEQNPDRGGLGSPPTGLRDRRP